MHDQARTPAERAQLAAAQQGSVDAVEKVVAPHQGEILGAAFLLTGSQRGAVRLGEQAVIRAVSTLRRVDPEAPARAWLLSSLALAFLDAVERGERFPDDLSIEPGSERFQVDTNRSRLRAALALLDEPARIAIVLSDLCHLPLNDIARVLNLDAGATAGLVERARARLQAIIDAREPHAVAVALREATIEAPRTDLWPGIEAEVSQMLERYRLRARVLAAGSIAVIASITLGLAGLLVFGAITGDDGPKTQAAAPLAIVLPDPTPAPTSSAADPTPTPEPSYVPPADVPDHFLRASELLDGRDRTVAHNPLTGAVTELAAGAPVGISPDGTQLYFIDDRTEDGLVVRSLVAVWTASLETAWTAEVARLQPGDAKRAVLSVTAVKGRVYVIANDPANLSDRVRVKLLGQEEGDERGNWEFITEPGQVAGKIDAFLFATPDESTMVVAFRHRETGAVHVKRLLVGVIDSITHAAAPEPPEFRFEDAIVAPGGWALYTPPRSGSPRDVAVRFFDLESLTVSPLRLPFTPVDAGEGTALLVESIPSHDGRKLYVLSPYDGQVAVIDLERRLIERLIPLDMGEIAVTRPEDLALPAIAHAYRPGVAALSPDGQYLYAAGTAYRGDGAVATGIWRIDTTTWTLTDHWAQRHLASIRSINVSASGDLLYVYTAASGLDRDTERRVGKLHVLDAHTGEPVIVRTDMLPSFGVLGSLARLYLNEFGLSPSIAGVAPAVHDNFTSLPLAEITIDPPFVDPGRTVSIIARFLDPTTRQPLTGPDPHVRFDPTTTVTVALSSRASEQIAILASDSFGVYSARVTVAEPAVWDARLMVGTPADDGWDASFEEVLNSQAVFLGTDGRAYVMAASTQPNQPLAGQPAEIIVHVIDVDTGKRIHDSVDFRGGGLPAELTLKIDAPGEGESKSFPLFYGGHGVYSGVVVFPEPGRQLPTVSFIARGDLLFGTRIGPINVLPQE